MSNSPINSEGNPGNSASDPPGRSRWQLIRGAFEELQTIPESSQTAALEQRFPNDPQARAAVTRLLEGARAAPRFMARPTAAESSGEDALELVGTSIGPYRLERHIGAGSFGDVFVAMRDSLNKKFALKILKAGMDSRQVLTRFRLEQDALERMNHPHIAAVVDAGMSSTGRPYIVMELVDGVPITQYADVHHLSLRSRLMLISQVCDAVEHAHTNAVIHRDLKPSNILVCGLPETPCVKVIDFGIAKATDLALFPRASATVATDRRQLIGTPEYMSPEQIIGSIEVNTRSDVYALGVLMYELLTGHLPFDGLRAGSIGEMERIIRDEDPPTLERRLQREPPVIQDRIAQLRGMSRTQLKRAFRTDLRWIVMQAMSKSPEARYKAPSLIAEDISLHLAGEPVRAAPPSSLYIIRKYLGKRKRTVVAASLLMLSLMVGGALTMWQAGRASALESESARHLRDAEAFSRASEARRLVGLSEQAGSAAPTRRALLAAEAVAALDLSVDELPPSCLQNLLNAAATVDGVPIWGHSGAVVHAEFSPDDQFILTASHDGTACVWPRPVRGAALHPIVLRGHTDALTCAAFSPDGCSVATGSADGTARIWNLEHQNPSATHVVLPGHRERVTRVAFSSDGKYLATSSRDAQVRLWLMDNLLSEPTVLCGHTDWVHSLQFCAGGRKLMSGGNDGIVNIWDLSQPSPYQSRATIQLDHYILGVKASGDGQIVVAPSKLSPASQVFEDGAIPLMPPIREYDSDDGPQNCCELSPDGRWLYLALATGGIEVWDLESRAGTFPALVLPGGRSPVLSLQASPNGRYIACGCSDGAACIWDLSAPNPPDSLRVLQGHDAEVRKVSFSNDSQQLLTASLDGTARIWDAQHNNGSKAVWELRGHPTREILSLAFGPSDHILYSTSVNGVSCSWDLSMHQPCRRQTPRADQFGTTFCTRIDQGSSLVIVRKDNCRIHFLDFVDGCFDALRETSAECAATPWGRPAASPDNTLLAVGTRLFTVEVFEIGHNRPVRRRWTLDAHMDEVMSTAFSSDNRFVYSADESNVVLRWDLQCAHPELSAVAPIPKQTEWVLSMVSSSDGSHLMTAGADHLVHLWKVSPSGQYEEVASLGGHTDWIWDAQYDSTETRIVTASIDKSARIWNLSDSSPEGTAIALRGHESTVSTARFSPTGRYVATGGHDGVVRVWPLDLRELCARLQHVIGRDLTPTEWRAAFPGKPYRGTWQALERALAAASGPP